MINRKRNISFNNVLKSDSKIFLDTCSFMHESCFPFVKEVEAGLINKKKGFVSARSVSDELKGLSKSRNTNINEKAKNNMMIFLKSF